jgi:hypothetical protein
LLSVLFNSAALTQTLNRTFSGTVVTQQFELMPNVSVEVQTSDGKLQTVTDAEGNFSLKVPSEPLSVKFFGKNIDPVTRMFAVTDMLINLQIKISYIVAPVNESVTIEDNTLTPQIEFRNKNIYNKTLFSRDDQVFQTLNAGINAGQHEGGGKSLEVRRFGFNLDHGGVNGGLKILVDDVQQNQASQAHGQGYLGSLKSLTPELVDEVSIINGPFSAQYGDFSGLGVVQIRLKEELPNQLTMRLSGGNFNSYRTFLAYSPRIKNVASFVSYEGSRSDGPFINPLKYKRDNLTGNFTFKRGESEVYGFKFNAARNTFFSSGQIPLDEVAAGRLDRFGFVDPNDGGKVYSAVGSAYYRKEFKSSSSFKADGFIARSLFDLYSNFTFFLLDAKYGDEIQQHDSRLQEGVNVQYLHPYKLGGNQSLLTVGGNLHFNQINVGLYPTIARNPIRKFLPENRIYRDDNGDGIDDVLYTSALAKVNNYAAYIQNGIDFYNGHIHVEGGLRIDTFTFNVNGFEDFDQNNQRINLNGKTSSTKLQPKFGLTISPFEHFPTSFYFNYGRGINSQDARGIIKNTDSPKIALTDFYQAGSTTNFKRFSATADVFLIDRSNEQVYIPDDGSLEFKGPSRSYGYEAKTSVRIVRFLSFNGGFTQVLSSFYRGTAPRVFVDSAPHFVANADLNLSNLRDFDASLRYRHINHYRLDGLDETIRAAGHDVVDFSLSKRLKRWVDFNFSVDNLLNKHYFETQNFIESRICPMCEIVSQIYGTPGYSRTVSAGLTFRFFAKN